LSALHIAGARIARIAVAVAVASAVALSALVPMASGDELAARRAQVKQQIAKTKGDLGESTKALSKAAVAVDKAQHRLDVASAQLATTRQELSAAEVQDSRMAVRLRMARADLGVAIAAVNAGQARLDAEQTKAGQMIRDQYQQQSNLLPVAVLLDPHSTEDVQTRLQWSTTLFDSTQAQIDRLNAALAEGRRIRGFGVLPRTLSAQDEELTPTLRIQRQMAQRSFSEQIEALYG